MRKLLLLFLCCVPFFISCNKDKKETLQQGRLDIHIINQTKADDDKVGAPMPAEVLKNAAYFGCMAAGIWDNELMLGISENDKDFENNIIKVWGDYILYPSYDEANDREYLKLLDDGPYHIINRHNWRVCDENGKVLAYLPDEVFKENKIKIQALFKEKKYKEIYKLLQEAFTAIPITEEEYNKLEQSHPKK